MSSTEAGTSTILNQAAGVATSAQDLADQAAALARAAGNGSHTIMTSVSTSGDHFLMMGLTVFVLACFVGYYVVWRVTPALHAPLMAMTNAISSVVIVGALIAAGLTGGSIAKVFGFLAVLLAAINIFGGFVVTNRMLAMFRKKS